MTAKKICSLLSLVCALTLGTLVAAGSAIAADMSAPAYKAPAMPAYNWSGFYVGVTAGGGMASLPVTDVDDFDFFTNSSALKSGGAVAGLHVGYNWQFAPSFLVGLEGDFNWSSFKTSDTSCFGSCANTSNLFDDDKHIATSKLDEFSTLRARFGLTSDRTLVYVTAGPTWGHINSSLTAVNCLNPNFCSIPLGAPFGIASDSSFHVGVALGAGVEYALTQNWIIRGEYLHLDFASKDTLFKDPTTGIPFTSGQRASSTATADIARVGVSYKVW